MNRKWSVLFLSLIVFAFLVGCGKTDSNTTEDATAETQAKAKEDVKANDEAEEEATASETTKSLALPDGLPSDFPLPNPMKIIEVNDKSDDSEYYYEIRFTFDPNIDMDETFVMYKDYAQGLDYSIVIGGEEYFANGIFQFSATSKFSSSDMFVITLKPDGETYGDITFKLTK